MPKMILIFIIAVQKTKKNNNPVLIIIMCSWLTEACSHSSTFEFILSNEFISSNEFILAGYLWSSE